MLGFDSRRACEKIVPILNCLAGGRRREVLRPRVRGAGCAGRVVGRRARRYRFVEGFARNRPPQGQGYENLWRLRRTLPMDPCAALPHLAVASITTRRKCGVRRVLSLLTPRRALAEITGLTEITGSASDAAAFVYESFTTHLRPLPPLTCTAPSPPPPSSSSRPRRRAPPSSSCPPPCPGRRSPSPCPSPR